MYDFLRRPMWILSHVLIAVLIVVLIALGFWQRSRWIEEADRAERLEQRSQADPVAYDAVIEPGTEPADVDPELRFTRVELRGTYDTAAELTVLNRSQGGAPGAWVLTPLVRPDGTAVPVIRGWIPSSASGSSEVPTDAAPPGGEVTVTGTIQLTQERGGFGAIDAAEGELDTLARVDLERFAQQLPYELGGAWVALDGQQPPQQGSLPQPVDLTRADPSQNFSYMVQWWIFAVIASVGYPLVLRSVARHRLRDRPAEAAGDGDAPGDGDAEGDGDAAPDVPAGSRSV